MFCKGKPTTIKAWDKSKFFLEVVWFDWFRLISLSGHLYLLRFDLFDKLLWRWVWRKRFEKCICQSLAKRQQKSGSNIFVCGRGHFKWHCNEFKGDWLNKANYILLAKEFHSLMARSMSNIVTFTWWSRRCHKWIHHWQTHPANELWKIFKFGLITKAVFNSLLPCCPKG